jgi:hypothetical protein
MRFGQADYLTPTSFAEMGASVPFTTPALVNARVRASWRNELEIVIEQFVGGSTFYVLPWMALPEHVSLTVHDTVLHGEIQERRALDPQAIRLAAIAIAAEGLAGPELVDAALKARADDEEANALTHLLLILKVIEEVDEARAKSLMGALRKPEGRDRIRQTLYEVGTRLDLGPQVFDDRLAEMANLTCQIGVPWKPDQGRLRRQVGRLEVFSSQAKAWGSSRLGEVSEQATYASRVSGQSARLARKTVDALDRLMASPRDSVLNWMQLEETVRALSCRLAWLLDGWPCLIEAWFESGSDEEIFAALASIVQRAPIVPRGEGGSGRIEATAESSSSSRRRTKLNEDWKTGEPDREMVQRLESMRAMAF